MADNEKLDLTTRIRALTAQAAENYYQIRIVLDQMTDAGILPDTTNGETVPTNPITTDDFADTAHSDITAEQFYAATQAWNGIGTSFDAPTRRLFRTFGKV